MAPTDDEAGGHGHGHSPVPHLHLLCMEERFATAFTTARARYGLPAAVAVTVHAGCALSQLPPTVPFDTVVSPANAYGRLDGAFDDALSRALAPRDDYGALTRAAQAVLYRRSRGFAVPGSCTLVRLPEELLVPGRTRNIWGVRRVALCPTMRLPGTAAWDREVVYECVWSLLCAVDNHNRALGEEADDEAERIRNVLMPPLATGVGRVSPERWAGQTVLALKHFIAAVSHPEEWGRKEWEQATRDSAEVATTWEEEGP